MAGKKTCSKGVQSTGAGKDEQAHAEVPEPRAIIDCHRRLWAKIKSMLSERLEHGVAEGAFEELRFVKTSGEALSIIVKGERLAWGIDEASPEGEADDGDTIAEEMAGLTVPSGAGEAMD